MTREEFQEFQVVLDKLVDLALDNKMKIWHEIAKEPPTIGENVCILWDDSIITTGVWDEKNSISSFMKYWCLSSDICLPKELN